MGIGVGILLLVIDLYEGVVRVSAWNRTVVGSCLLFCSIAGCGGDDDSAASTSTEAPTTALATTHAPDTTVAPTTALPIEGALTLDEARNVIDAVLVAFNAKDVDAISAIVGDGKWVGIAGGEFDSTTAGPYLAPLLTPIDSTEVNGDPSPVPGGYAFPLKEHTFAGFNNYYIIVYTDADGVLTIRESTGPTLPG